MSPKKIFPAASLLFLPAYSFATSPQEIIDVIVVNPRVANEQPATGYTTLATALRFDPSVELQSRGLAEGQSDVTVRGSVFENVGFKLGALNIYDPQTGHYVVDLPVSTEILGKPVVRTDIDSALLGFNSSIATISYDFREIEDRGSIELGFGSDDLNFQSLNFFDLNELKSGNSLGYGLTLSRSEGDGSIENGDHQFRMANAQFQYRTDTSQSDLVIGYQDKFFGWPGAYTGFSNLAETDDTQTTLVLVNQKRVLADGWVEVGAYYRKLEDNYDFDRTTIEDGGEGAFEHETQVIGAGFQGVKKYGITSWKVAGQISKDKLVRSTDLVEGDFTDRTYATISLVPEIAYALEDNKRFIFNIGASYDYSNRDEDELSPLAGVAYETNSKGRSTLYKLEYAETTQLTGYTALKSRPMGLFAGNSELGRESAKQLSASIKHQRENWNVSATFFTREDDDLVDWTFFTGAPFARQANPVDIDVNGIELIYSRFNDKYNLVISHTILDKDSDYGDANVDASFYALNYAKRRTTLAVSYNLPSNFRINVDSEYRSQEDNPLREGDNSAFLLSASLGWTSNDGKLSVQAIIDNATDSSYQPFPGTPANGRQLAISTRYNW